MKITVCEFDNDISKLEATWEALATHCQERESELILLPEMPFNTWLAGSHNVDDALWDESVTIHDEWLERLGELGVSIVVGTRPVRVKDVKLNEGFIWTESQGYRAVHQKVYLPNEPGFWEASWYSPGPEEFKLVEAGGVKIGFLICTELWFTQHARNYMKAGMDVLVCPRATPLATLEKWIVGGRAAAIVSGAYCLSSSLSGKNSTGQEFAGAGWVIEPWNGDLIGTTSREYPFMTKEIEIDKARAAKLTYPRDVIDEF